MSDGHDRELDDELEDAGTEGAGLPEGGEDPTFRRLLEKLYAEHHFDFRQYKEASLVRRVRRRMAQVHVDSVDGYLSFLDRHRDEHTALLNMLLINVTRFFRDPAAWSVLRDRVLPPLIDQAATRTLRVWSAGCSSGEEPYTLAMLLAEALGTRKDQFEIKIYATDIDEDALTTARAGLYRLEQLKDVPRELLERHFIAEGHAFRVRRSLRKWCIFGRHDLTQDAPFSHMDMVVCRNVLIYFDSDLQDRVLPRFQYAVRNDGCLFLGRSESLLVRSRRFVPVDLKWRIFQRIVHSGADAQLARPLADDLPERSAAPSSQPQVPRVQRNDVLETLTSAIVVIDPAETIVAWNVAAEGLFEIPADHAVGRKFRDLDVSYRIDGLRARVEAVRGTHAAAQMQDVVFARRSGSEMIHANIRIAPIFDERRHSAGIVISGEDISDVGRLRDELDRLAEQSATANEELQSTNEELETTNEELQSTNEELETTNEELQSTNEELEATVEELQSTNSELGTLNIELERRTAELNRLEGLQRGVLDTLGMALFILDPDLTVTHWNGSATRLWGVRSEAALGREFLALPLGDTTRVGRDALRRVRDTHRPERLGPLPYAVDGDGQRETMLDLTAILSPTGELLGIFGVATGPGAAQGGS